ASGAAKVQTSSNGEWVFFIDQARQQVVGCAESSSTRKARIASLTLVYQPCLSRAFSTMDYRESLNPWEPFRSFAGVGFRFRPAEELPIPNDASPAPMNAPRRAPNKELEIRARLA